MSSLIADIFSDRPLIRLARAAQLFRTGDDVRLMFLVAEGQVLLRRHSRQGLQLVLQRASSGSVLAEASAYSETYHCDAVADADSTLRALPVAAFRSRLAADATLSQAWAAYLAHEVQAARMRAEIRSLNTVAERLDFWLGTNGALPERGQWQGLAGELGVSREAVYRELAKRRAAAERR